MENNDRKVLVRNFNVKVEDTTFNVQVETVNVTPFFKLEQKNTLWNNLTRHQYTTNAKKILDK